MTSNKTTYIVFVFACIAQLCFPAFMIWDTEKAIESGTVYKFETRPIDPTDPFRGKYITLRFKEDKASVDSLLHWQRGQTIYVEIQNDSVGYASIKNIHTSEPANDVDFIEAKIDHKHYRESKIYVEYPFKRYYMHEGKAKPAEQLQRMLRDSLPTYAVVHVRNGTAVLTDVKIGDESIKNMVEPKN